MELSAQELRIGNLITVHGYLQEVCELPLPENCTDENTKPIPLTEEWLLRFGFDKALNGYWDETENWCVRENDFFIGARMYLGKVEFVHQLQNLYFALTGEELTLNN